MRNNNFEQRVNAAQIIQSSPVVIFPLFLKPKAKEVTDLEENGISIRKKSIYLSIEKWKDLLE